MGSLFARSLKELPAFCGDAALGKAWKHFQAGDRRPLLALLAQPIAQERYFVAMELGQVMSRELAEKWAIGEPCEGTLLVRSAQGLNWAWEARSSRMASEVGEGQWAEFARRLKIVEEELEELTDPANQLSLRLLLAKGQDRPQADRCELGQQLMAADPSHVPGLTNYIDSILQKWGGRPGQAIQEATRLARAAPPGTALGGLVASTWIEEWLYLEAFEKAHEKAQAFLTRAEVVSTTHEVYAHSFGSSHFQDTPATIEPANHMTFWLYLSAQKGLLARELKRLRGRFSRSPWCYLGNEVQAIRKAIAMAG